MLLGVINWGIGGMGFVRAFRRAHPAVPIVYWSDTGSTPYGKLSTSALRTRLQTVVGALEGKGATHVVVGCNAASTVVDKLSVDGAVTGIIDHGVAAAVDRLADRPHLARVGVIGGRRTVISQVYRRRLEAAGLRVRQRVGHPIRKRRVG